MALLLTLISNRFLLLFVYFLVTESDVKLSQVSNTAQLSLKLFVVEQQAGWLVMRAT